MYEQTEARGKNGEQGKTAKCMLPRYADGSRSTGIIVVYTVSGHISIIIKLRACAFAPPFFCLSIVHTGDSTNNAALHQSSPKKAIHFGAGETRMPSRQCRPSSCHLQPISGLLLKSYIDARQSLAK